MIDPACSPEVAGIIAYAQTTGVPFRVTSTYRPGAVTAAGNPSRHGRRLAVDFAGPHPGRDTDELAAIFKAFLPVEHKLNELIYAGPQVGFNIKAGKRVHKYAQGIHHDHVHVAVDPGLVLASVNPVVVVQSIVAPAPADSDGREDMAEPVDALCAPTGGVWVLTRDGGVRAYHRAPFYGSYPGLPPEGRQGGERTFVEIRPNDQGGYTLISSGNESYAFGP
jgi:hypothetical protein